MTCSCDPNRIQTCDLFIRSEPLYSLSYGAGGAWCRKSKLHHADMKGTKKALSGSGLSA